MVHETAAAIEFDRAVAVVHFQVQKLGAVLTRNSFGKLEKFGANSLASMGRLDEKFVDPRTFAAVFQAEIEADDQIADRDLLIASQIDQAERCPEARRGFGAKWFRRKPQTKDHPVASGASGIAAYPGLHEWQDRRSKTWEWAPVNRG